MAFALSGFIAGIGGALLAMQQQNVNYGTNFYPLAALFWIVLVVTLGTRSVEGAIIAALSFAFLDAVILKGAFIGWIFRDTDAIPGIFPIGGSWRFVLFGLGALQFARHPDGILDYGKRQRFARAERRAARRHGGGGDSSAVGPDDASVSAMEAIR